MIKILTLLNLFINLNSNNKMYFVDNSPLRAEFLNENQVHIDYMLNYHVARCPGNICDTEPCLFYHLDETRRRKIFRFSNTSFNYKPQECLNVKNCEYKETCIYAHNQDEIFYHPMLYKTVRCSYPLENDICSKYGVHCP